MNEFNMWIKLTETEITKYRKKYFIKHFINYFLLIFIVITLAHKYGWSKTGLSRPVEWNQLLYDLPILFIISLVISLLISLHDTKVPESLMCDKCLKYKKYDRNYTCECGGKFIDFKYMKYIENNDEK